MKRSYTTMDTTLRYISKSTGEPFEQIIDRIASYGPEDFRDFNLSELGWSDFVIFRNGFLIESKILSGDCVHVYMPDKSFCDWLVSCVKDLSAENAGILQEELGIDKSIVLHFPNKEGLVSVGFIIPKHSPTLFEDGNITYDITAHNHLTMIFSRNSGFSVPCCQFVLNGKGEAIDNGWLETSDALYYAKLIIGLGQYLSCFPEQLKDGIPDDLKHPSYHNHKRSKHVSICQKILHTSHASPQAHYRVGHFRLLSSPWYKNKRNHVIFVEGTFVNGRVKTVLPIV